LIYLADRLSNYFDFHFLTYLLAGGGDGGELHGIAPVVELDDGITGDGDFLKRIYGGVKGDRQGGIADDFGGTAQVMDLDEVIRVSDLLRRASKAGLSNYFDFYFLFSPFFGNF